MARLPNYNCERSVAHPPKADARSKRAPSTFIYGVSQRNAKIFNIRRRHMVYRDKKSYFYVYNPFLK